MRLGTMKKLNPFWRRLRVGESRNKEEILTIVKDESWETRPREIDVGKWFWEERLLKVSKFGLKEELGFKLEFELN